MAKSRLYATIKGLTRDYLPAAIESTRAPLSTDVGYPVGQLWVYLNNSVYELIGYQNAGANWVSTGGSSLQLSALAGDSGSAAPAAGSITIAGTTNQISTAASGSTVTLSLPAALTAPGSVTATTSLAATTTITAGTGITATTGNIAASAGAVNAATSITATAGDITATLGNLILNGAAKQIRIKGGAVTDFIGTATLVSGTVTVANTNIAATDRIIVFRIAANASTTMGELSYTISAATSFTINALILGTPGSVQTGDASTVGYIIIRQL